MRKNLILRLICLEILVFSNLFFAQDYDELNKLRLAQSYEAIGNFEKALELYKDLYFKKPNDFNYYDGYLRGLAQLKRYDESITLIKSRLKIIPNDISLYAQLAVIYDRKEKPDSVSYYIKKGIDIDSKNLMTYKIISNVLIENRLFENAIEVLESGKGRVVNSSSLSIDLANLYSLLMNYRKASEELLNLVITDPNNYSFAQTKLSTFITRLDAIEIAIDVFESYKKKNENINILRLLSWLYLQAKQYEKSFNLTVEIDEKVKSNGFEILSFADRAYREKAIEVAVLAYNYLLKNYPNQKDIRAFSIIGLARANEEVFVSYQKKKEESWKKYTPSLSFEDKSADDVINYYNIIIRDFNNPTLTCEALYKISKIRYDYYFDLSFAENNLNEIIQKNPLSEFHTKALLLMGDIQKIKGDLTQAEKLYSDVKYSPRATDEDRYLSQFKFTQILLLKGLIDSSKNILIELSKNINMDISNDVLELLFLIQENEDSKEELINWAKAQYFIEAKKFNEAETELKKLLNKNEESSLISLAYLQLADISIYKNNYSDALAYVKYIIDQKEKSIYADRALIKQAEIYIYGIKDTETGIKLYEKFLSEFPQSIFVNEVRKKLKELKSNSL